MPNIKAEIKRQFGFEPDFENAKDYLEEADGAGNTFKATAKPVLIGTAVVGATTMVFGIIILLENMFGNVVAKLSLVQPEIILGLLMGGAVIYWFTGAATQAVVTGAYRAVVYIKNNIKLDAETASIKDSKEVVRICTVYAQKGMWNIFIVIFFMALALPFFNPYFFIGYLIAIAFFGLFQAIFMANAGGAWDNAKKIVEVDLQEKGTPLHEATVVGDTVGDPFKDTSSVAMNPVIKFTTLFGLLATEIAVTMQSSGPEDDPCHHILCRCAHLHLPILLQHEDRGGETGGCRALRHQRLRKRRPREGDAEAELKTKVPPSGGAFVLWGRDQPAIVPNKG